MKSIEKLLPHMSQKQYPSGCVISDSLKKNPALYYVVEGSLSLDIVSDDGSQSSHPIRKGGTVGAEYLFLPPEDTGAVRVRALTVATVAHIGVDKLKRLMDTELSDEKENIVVCVAKQLATLYVSLNKAKASQSGRTYDRVMAALRQCGTAEHPRGKQVKAKTDYLSDMLGLSGETVRKGVADLIRRGKLARLGREDYVIFE